MRNKLDEIVETNNQIAEMLKDVPEQYRQAYYCTKDDVYLASVICRELLPDALAPDIIEVARLLREERDFFLKIPND